MDYPTRKLNLEEAEGRKVEDDSAIKPTLRIRKSDFKVLRLQPEPKKKSMVGWLVALGVVVVLGGALWFFRGTWMPLLVSSQVLSAGEEAVVPEDDVDVEDALSAEETGARAGTPSPMPMPDGPLPPPDTLTYFSAAGWNDENFRQAVRHFNAGFDAYRAFLADDSSSRPLAVAESEAIAALKLLQELAANVPSDMQNEVAFDVLEARSLLAEVRRLARNPSASASASHRAATGGGSSAGISPTVDGQSKVWKNPDYLEGARTFNRAVAKYKEFLSDKSGKQALLKEIEDDAFVAAKKFESLKPSAPPGIPLQDHITQCYKLISDCRRQQLEHPSTPVSTGRAHPARRSN